MKLFFKNLIALFSLSLLVACGGGNDGGTFSFSDVTRGTSYSCPTQAALDVCAAGDCAQCTCTLGCSDPTVANAKIKVTMSTTTLTVNQPGTLTLDLSNAESTSQTVVFTLNYPAGPVSYSATDFSGSCTASSLSIGGLEISATVTVPANTDSCTFAVQKQFTQAANPVSFTLTNLDNVELDGSVPSLTVTAQ